MLKLTLRYLDHIHYILLFVKQLHYSTLHFLCSPEFQKYHKIKVLLSF